MPQLDEKDLRTAELYDCVVAGGGPAGMMAAITAAGAGMKTVLLEKNDSPGKKLLLTGGGRCNITNLADTSTFIKAFGPSGGFLRHALGVFGPSALCEFMRRSGAALVEESGKVFARDGARRVLETLKNLLESSGVEVRCRERVVSIHKEGGAWTAVTTRGRFAALKKLVLSPGGMTYPATGSSGDGYEWAGLLGHKVIAPKPAAGPLRLMPNPFAGLEGTQVDCARLTVLEGGKKLGIFEGGMMITRDGVSGPAVLDASVEIVRRAGGKAISIEADFAPGERREDLAALFRRVRRESPSKRLSNCPVATGVPRRLYAALLAGAKVSGEKRPAETSSAEMHAVIEAIKRFRLNVGGGGGADECMVTVGGVSTAEVDSKTMESRVARGVYFAGEFLDLAGPCGGFNLQCAFSTGFLAGTAEKTDSTTESTEGAQRTQRKKS